MIIAELLARSGEGWKSGPIGLAVILVLCVASYFLFKSMSKHLRKVREEFPVGQEQPSPTVEASPTSPATPAQPAQSDPESPG
ncbi:MAG: hypothetical protein M3070_15660 [Actinomycetota bacterium]|nr:hypothetical protein [Actinomycetota bacterium]